MLRMNKVVRKQLRTGYQKLLDRGDFPDVRWRHGVTFEYNTAEYLKFWGRMAHLVDQALKQRGYNLGCYELRRSERFRADAIQIINSIQPQEVAECTSMFGIPGQC